MNKSIVSYVASVVLVAFLLGTVLGQASSPSYATYIMGGSQTAAAGYIISSNSGTYFYRNGNSGLVASSDNVTEILATIGGSQRIHFKAGQYVLDTYNAIASDSVITGEGESTILFVNDTSNIGSYGVLNLDSVENVTIENLKIDGNKDGQSSGFSRCIYVIDCKNIRISKVTAIDAVFCGIDVRGSEDVFISDSLFENNTATWVTTTFGCGVYIRTNLSGVYSTRVVLDNCIARFNGNLTEGGDGSGFQVYGQGQVTMTNIVSNYNARYGVKSQCGNFTLSNFQCNNNSFGLSVSTGFDANNTMICNGKCLYNEEYGVLFSAPATMSNVEIAYNEATGLRIEAASGVFYGTLLSNLNIHDNAVNGLDIRGVQWTTVTGCQIHNNTDSGIWLTDYGALYTLHTTFVGCQTYGNGEYGARENSNSDYTLFISHQNKENGYGTIPLVGTYSRYTQSLEENTFLTGYKIGLASISSSTYTDVTHGVGSPPSCVLVTPSYSADIGTATMFFVSNVGATTFRINAVPSGSYSVYWIAFDY